MLKEITRAEAVERMAAEKPVFMLHEIDGTMTINDLLTTDGFVIEVPNEETLKAIKESFEHPEQCEKYHSVDELIEHLEPRNNLAEPRNEVGEADSEAKRSSSEETKKGRPKIDREKVLKLHEDGLPYKMIAKEVGCSEWSVCQIINQEKKKK